MKRTIALVLSLLFVLTLLPAVNGAKADTIKPLSIEIDTPATKRVYAVGEALDITGLILTYNDGISQPGTSVDITKYVASNPSEGYYTTSIANGYVFTSDDVGEKTITVTYNAGTPTGYTQVQKPTTSYTVTVVAAETGYPTGFSIVSYPANTSYYEGETFVTEGLELRAIYTNGANPDLPLSDVVITPASDHLLTTADGGTDKATITWSKEYPSQTLVFTKTFDLSVDEAATSISVADSGPATSHTFLYSDIGTSAGQVVLTCTVSPTDAGVTWGSSDPSVASVEVTSAGVVVTALKPGSATITATARGFDMDAAEPSYSSLQAIYGVVVKDNEVYPTGISLDKSSITLGKNSTDELTPAFTPSDATLTDVTWTLSIDDVALTAADYVSVDDGKITALKATPDGKPVIVTATVDGEGSGETYSASCAVTVIDIPVDSITISQTTATLYAGSTLTLNANVLPLNASNPTVTWGASLVDEDHISTTPMVSLATVVDGKVTTYDLATTVYPVTVNITATAGTQSATCTITLKDPTILTQLNLSKTNASLCVGDTLALTTTVLPSDATNKTLAWTSSNPSVASVDSNGKVTAKTAGNTIIKVDSTDGSGLSASCNVNVSTVNVIIVSLNKTSLTLVEGNSETLTASVYPSNATTPALKWTSSNTSVATVDSTGKITAKSLSGYAIITASATDGSGKFAECYVITQARVAVTGITLNYGTALDIILGDSTYLKATVLPSTATDTTVTWSSSNTSVATIDSSTGLLTSVKLGETTITATVDGKSVTMKVTVTNSEYNYGVAANFRRRVNVRASASGLSKLVGYAYLGDTFHILGRTGNWYYIQYNNTTKAYIWANYLKATKTSSGYTAAATTTSGSSGSTTTTTTATPTTVTITNCLYAVNVRSGPSTTNTRIGKAKLGATYTYLGTEGDWYKVQYNSTTIGYIYGTFVSLS